MPPGNVSSVEDKNFQFLSVAEIQIIDSEMMGI